MPTIEEARERIARLRTDGLPWRIRLGIRPGCRYRGPIGDVDEGWNCDIEIKWQSTDTDGGSGRELTALVMVGHREDILQAARRAIRTIVLHEIDEQLMVDGVRRWEPHPIVDGRRQPTFTLDPEA